MTERQDDDEVTLNCSISGYEAKCSHTVKLVYQGQDVGKDSKDMKTSQSLCSASVSFTTSHYIYTSKNYEPLKCKVTDRESEVKQFNFSPESSGEKTGENKMRNHFNLTCIITQVTSLFQGFEDKIQNLFLFIYLHKGHNK